MKTDICNVSLLIKIRIGSIATGRMFVYVSINSVTSES